MKKKMMQTPMQLKTRLLMIQKLILKWLKCKISSLFISQLHKLASTIKTQQTELAKTHMKKKMMKVSMHLKTHLLMILILMIQKHILKGLKFKISSLKILHLHKLASAIKTQQTELKITLMKKMMKANNMTKTGETGQS